MDYGAHGIEHSLASVRWLRDRLTRLLRIYSRSINLAQLGLKASCAAARDAPDTRRERSASQKRSLCRP